MQILLKVRSNSKKKSVFFCFFVGYALLLQRISAKRLIMSYREIAQLELLNALNNINSEAELNEFKDLVAHFFAQKAQKAIDALWDEGVINEGTIEQWGTEHMRTPYRYATNRS